MNATERWRASWVEIVPSFALEREFSRAINEPREPLLPWPRGNRRLHVAFFNQPAEMAR